MKLRFPPQPDPAGMQLADFTIGKRFLLGDNRWQVTDIGTRTVVAIMVAPGEDASWLKGPPYAVVEHVFDEHDLPGCAPWPTELK